MGEGRHMAGASAVAKLAATMVFIAALAFVFASEEARGEMAAQVKLARPDCVSLLAF